MLTLSNGFVVNSGGKVMKTMEKTGLLEQFLHCSAVPKYFGIKTLHTVRILIC
jgi:hypothetical protein